MVRQVNGSWLVVARQHGNIIMCYIDNNLEGSKMHLCHVFGCSTPHRRAGRQTNRDLMCYFKVLD